jgi:hypothetical protein
MAKAGRVRATTSFAFEHDGTTIVVHAGDGFASTHPAVKKHRELFTPETATAAPGERPRTRRGRGVSFSSSPRPPRG